MLKSSIKMKFFYNFLIILIISEVSLILLSNFFLNDLMISANKILIQNVYSESEAYFKLEELNQEKIKSIASNNDIGIIIYENGEILACLSELNCDETNTLPDYLATYLPKIQENSNWANEFHLSTINVNQLVYFYNVGNGRYVIFDKALTAIQEINQILQPFIIVFGFIVLLMGSLIIFYMSKKISRPIIKISEYASDIAQLKFDEQLSIHDKNEIGLLANNMNLISVKLNRALNELKADLEKEKELDKNRVRFFSSVSHEFKTPLTIIQGYAEGLKHNIAKTDEEKTEYYDIIIEETKKMHHFVNDLLNLSLYESGNFLLQKMKFDLVDLINKTVYKMNDLIKNKKINLIITGCKKCQIEADAYRMEQVITNFMSNAIKYVPDNGTIKITVKEEEKFVRMSFFNNGNRIETSEIEKIWTLFYKLETKKNQIGTGIGLAIVKSIIELHNGGYGVMNQPDGVEFYVELPK